MPRSAGILMPITSLPSPYGIGTLGKAAYEYVDFLKAAGQTYWQLLPVGPTSYGDSPYQSFSTYAGNPYMIDLDLLCDEGLLIRDDLKKMDWGENSQYVDYERLYNIRFDVLRQAYEAFKQKDQQEFWDFMRDENSWLTDYALYMAVKKLFDDKPWTEYITFNDKLITKMNTDQLALFRRQNCGFVFQQTYLVDSMSVLDNVLSAALLVEKNKKTAVKKAQDLLLSVDIEEALWNKFPSQISGGEAQRVGIARALVNSPKLVFADEPTGALNSKTGKDVLDVLTRFNQKGQSIVMVTHDINSARRANRILYVKDGEIAGELDLGAYVSGDKERHQNLRDFLSGMGW